MKLPFGISFSLPMQSFCPTVLVHISIRETKKVGIFVDVLCKSLLLDIGIAHVGFTKSMSSALQHEK